MKKFEEKQWIKIIDYVWISVFVTWICNFLLMASNPVFMYGMLLLPIAVVLHVIGALFSNKNRYTNTLLSYMRTELDKLTTLKELVALRSMFEECATEHGIYILPYSQSLKDIHLELNSKIAILNSILKNDKKGSN